MIVPALLSLVTFRVESGGRLGEDCRYLSYPLIDRAIGGGIDGIIAVSDPISAATTNAPTIIPGHSPRQRAYRGRRWMVFSVNS